MDRGDKHSNTPSDVHLRPALLAERVAAEVDELLCDAGLESGMPGDLHQARHRFLMLLASGARASVVDLEILDEIERRYSRSLHLLRH